MTVKEGGSDSAPETLCGDCPPVGYPTDKTRCLPCPRRDSPMTNDEALERVKADIAETCPEGSKWSCALVDKHALTHLLSRYERMEKDALRYRYLVEHRSYHYGMSLIEPSPAEWGIEWQYQQSKPGEQFETIDSLIDAEIALLDEEDRQALGASE